MTVIVCSLITTLTQKRTLRAAKRTASYESASAVHPALLTNTHLHWLISLGKKKHAAMVTDSFSPVFFSTSSSSSHSFSSSISAPIANDSSNVCSCRLTGRASEIDCDTARLLLGGRFSWDCGLLCVSCLLQHNQEVIVFEVLGISTPVAQVEVKGLTPSGTDEHITSQSMSEPVAM